MSSPDYSSYAIGVFDSGLGGLTVMKALMRQLPHEHIVYLGDTARVPYGTKSRESIIRFSKENAEVLLRHKVKMIVVACNSSSSYALEALRRQFAVPVLGVIAPGVRRAVEMTRVKTVGVIATPATVASEAYARHIRREDPEITVISQACPLFVPLVEEGWFDREVTVRVAREYLCPIKQSGADTLILGCTHYPLLKTVIRRVLGPKVQLVDSAQAVSADVQALLQRQGLERARRASPRYQFLVTDQPGHFQRLARRFLDDDIRNIKKVRV